MRTYDFNDSSGEEFVRSSTLPSAPSARFLPESLIRARAAVFDPENCLDLSMTARRAMYGILAFVSAKNLSQEVFASRDLLRAEAMLGSLATLYRGLAMLQQKGYIERRQIRRRDKTSFGQYHVSQIFLTLKSRVLLNLDEVIHSTRPRNVRGRLQEEHTKPHQSIKNTTGKPEACDKEFDKTTGLPAELVPLLDLDVKKSAICWLMKQARKANKRLGDIVKTVAHRLAFLRDREVVAYLKKMIRTNLDYNWIAKDKAAQNEQAAISDQVKEKLAALNERFDGLTVIDHAGRSLGIFRAANRGGQHVVEGAKGCMPVNLRFAKAWMDGQIQFSRHSSGNQAGNSADDRDDFETDEYGDEY